MENLGVKKSTVGLVIPTGYSFNLDGTSIYLTMAAVFIALVLLHEMPGVLSLVGGAVALGGVILANKKP